MTRLPRSFLTRPLAHRALHDHVAGRPENSLAAIRAAIGAGYGVELDLQLSADGCAMVFHDYDLERLTEQSGAVRDRSAAELSGITLRNSDETIPSLQAALDLVAGRCPILLELKDQTGAMGPGIGALEAATAQALAGYRGDVALMSFNPHSVAEMARLCSDRPRGLVTSSYAPADWDLPQDTCDRLRAIPDYDRVGASFISHEATDLARPHVKELKAAGADILCWTIRTPEQEVKARGVADNITFEGYLPA